MPANLTPEYRRAEQQFRSAKTTEDKIAALEEMLRVIPKHKGTDGLQGDLKARLAKLRKQPAKKGARASHSHMVPREGAGQVALVGPPNTGKSALLAALTHASPIVADYPFSTREALPGMMAFEDIAFQLVDLPPVSAQHVEPWVLDLARAADLLWIVVDGLAPLVGFDDTRTILADRGLGLRPAGRPQPEGTASGLERPALIVLTGQDKAGAAEAMTVLDELLERRWPLAGVSSVTRQGLEDLARRTFEDFGLIRVYTKQPGQPRADGAPFTLPRGATVRDLAVRIHKDLVELMKFARVWGPSAFDGQAVHKDHRLAEGDIVEIHV